MNSKMNSKRLKRNVVDVNDDVQNEAAPLAAIAKVAAKAVVNKNVAAKASKAAAKVGK